MRSRSRSPRPAAAPLSRFRRWFAQARAADPEFANAMVLSTVDARGRPSARVVLMKDIDEGGVTFFTNYDSRKARELAANASVALVFWWRALGRQVRIEGRVRRVTRAESEAYFATRPRGSQIGAWASPQSRPLPARARLLRRVRACTRRFAGGPVPCPPHWGGYRVTPDCIEFWTDRPSRLHDRDAYRRGRDGRWRRRRLAP